MPVINLNSHCVTECYFVSDFPFQIFGALGIRPLMMEMSSQNSSPRMNENAFRRLDICSGMETFSVSRGMSVNRTISEIVHVMVHS